MHRPIPNKLSRTELKELIDPHYAALVAFRLGTANTEHYHSMAGAMTIAHRIATTVQRHRERLADLQPAVDALNAIYGRHEQAGQPDEPWTGTPMEIDHIENGFRVFEALVRATPGKAVRRAILSIIRDVESS